MPRSAACPQPRPPLLPPTPAHPRASRRRPAAVLSQTFRSAQSTRGMELGMKQYRRLPGHRHRAHSSPDPRDRATWPTPSATGPAPPPGRARPPGHSAQPVQPRRSTHPQLARAGLRLRADVLANPSSPAFRSCRSAGSTPRCASCVAPLSCAGGALRSPGQAESRHLVMANIAAMPAPVTSPAPAATAATSTTLLTSGCAWQRERPPAFEHLLKLVYGELELWPWGGCAAPRRLARRRRPAARGPAARLAANARLERPGHFFGTVSLAMRSVLVDHARARQAEKRGGAWQHHLHAHRAW